MLAEEAQDRFRFVTLGRGRFSDDRAPNIIEGVEDFVIGSASCGHAGWKGARVRASIVPKEKKLAMIGNIGTFLLKNLRSQIDHIHSVHLGRRPPAPSCRIRPSTRLLKVGRTDGRTRGHPSEENSARGTGAHWMKEREMNSLLLLSVLSARWAFGFRTSPHPITCPSFDHPDDVAVLVQNHRAPVLERGEDRSRRRRNQMANKVTRKPELDLKSTVSPTFLTSADPRWIHFAGAIICFLFAGRWSLT